MGVPPATRGDVVEGVARTGAHPAVREDPRLRAAQAELLAREAQQAVAADELALLLADHVDPRDRDDDSPFGEE